MTVYEVITTRIVELLQQGTIPWRKPWSPGGGEPRNLVSGKAYRGVNVFLLSAMPFASPYWLTYRQATERGGTVRKGSKGCPVVFWRWSNAGDDEQAETGQGEAPAKHQAPLLRYYTVFNAEQCDGIVTPATVARTFEPIAEGLPNASEESIEDEQLAYPPLSICPRTIAAFSRRCARPAGRDTGP